MTQTLLSELTTAAVGGPAGNYVEARTEAEIIDAVRSADAAGGKILIIGGGSNLLISDDGYPGTVLKIASEGFTVNSEDSCGGVSVVVQAGHNWDASGGTFRAARLVRAGGVVRDPGGHGSHTCAERGRLWLRRFTDHCRGADLGP